MNARRPTLLENALAIYRNPLGMLLLGMTGIGGLGTAIYRVGVTKAAPIEKTDAVLTNQVKSLDQMRTLSTALVDLSNDVAEQKRDVQDMKEDVREIKRDVRSIKRSGLSDYRTTEPALVGRTHFHGERPE